MLLARSGRHPLLLLPRRRVHGPALVALHARQRRPMARDAARRHRPSRARGRARRDQYQTAGSTIAARSMTVCEMLAPLALKKSMVNGYFRSLVPTEELHADV